jgi:hypothetical protein
MLVAVVAACQAKNPTYGGRRPAGTLHLGQPSDGTELPSSTHLHIYSRVTIPRLGSVLLLAEGLWEAA